MNFEAPQIIMLALYFMTIGIAIETHGKLKTGKHNFWVTLIALVINVSILSWGGFFS